MRFRTFLVTSAIALCMFATVTPARADYDSNAYPLASTVIRGFVESVQSQLACIRTDNGEDIYVELGPEAYWESHRYWLTEGEPVEMRVWFDPTDRYTQRYFAGEIWGPDIHYVLTNDEGVPYWVIDANDYYYSLGYRASCVSYMYWYDCPPVYFVYLILPPPPPVTYVCYYGPHWRTHHRDWNYGPRYRRDGTYWSDGQGYEPPDHRPGGRTRPTPDQPTRTVTVSTSSVQHAPVVMRPVKPVTPVPQMPRPSVNQVQRLPLKSQTTMTSQKVVMPQWPTAPRREVTVIAAERRSTTPSAPAPQRSVQIPVKVSPVPSGNTPKIVPAPPRDNGAAKDKQITRSTQIDKRLLADNQRR
jgi:hypothetical protein